MPSFMPRAHTSSSSFTRPPVCLLLAPPGSNTSATASCHIGTLALRSMHRPWRFKKSAFQLAYASFELESLVRCSALVSIVLSPTRRG